MSIVSINPAELYDGSTSGMSHAKVDGDTGLVFVSGQVDWDPENGVGSHSMQSQTESAAKNLLKVLAEAGSSVEDVLQLRVYVRGEVGEHMETVVPIIAEYLGRNRPALTGVGVASLASPEILIEIEAVAKVARER